MKYVVGLLVVLALAAGAYFYFLKGDIGVKEEVVPRDRTAIIHTDFGDIKVKLYRETALHQANFVKQANDKIYDGTLFYRVIQDFVIQSGRPTVSGSEEPGHTIPSEIVMEDGKPKFTHKKGAMVAVVRNVNNPERASTGSDFYIILSDGNSRLDGSDTVFGEVIEGLDVAEKIAKVAVDKHDRPVEDIKMTVTMEN